MQKFLRHKGSTIQRNAKVFAHKSRCCIFLVQNNNPGTTATAIRFDNQVPYFFHMFTAHLHGFVLGYRIIISVIKNAIHAAHHSAGLQNIREQEIKHCLVLESHGILIIDKRFSKYSGADTPRAVSHIKMTTTIFECLERTVIDDGIGKVVLAPKRVNSRNFFLGQRLIIGSGIFLVDAFVCIKSFKKKLSFLLILGDQLCRIFHHSVFSLLFIRCPLQWGASDIHPA